jgi:hypothetical protein
MSRVGDDLAEAFDAIAASLRGSGKPESHELASDVLTVDRIKAIRRSAPRGAKAFETESHLPARTIEPYEQRSITVTA